MRKLFREWGGALVALLVVVALGALTLNATGCANDQRQRRMESARSSLQQLGEVNMVLRACADGSQNPQACTAVSGAIGSAIQSTCDVLRADKAELPSVCTKAPVPPQQE